MKNSHLSITSQIISGWMIGTCQLKLYWW